MRERRVLVLAPHHDDEAIGCGGLLLRQSRRGATVTVAVVFDPLEGSGTDAAACRYDEACEAARVLGVRETRSLGHPCRAHADTGTVTWDIVRVIRASRPHLLLIPHGQERDPEHRLVHALAIEAAWLSESDFRPELGPPAPPIRCILGYEVWTPIGRPQLVVDISAEMPEKGRAIAAYASQVAARDYVDGARGLARYRGAMMGGTRYAEAYDVVRAHATLVDLAAFR